MLISPATYGEDMITLFKIIVLAVLGAILIGCGGSAPTFDGTSEQSAESSVKAMYPNTDWGKGAEKDSELPPAAAAFACYSLSSAFMGIEVDGKEVGGMGSSDEEMEQVAKHVRAKFDGMTENEMVAFVEQQGISLNCLDEMG